MGVFLFLITLTVAAAAAVAAGAGAAVGAANALFALFLGRVNEQNAQGEDADNYGKYDNICGIHSITLSHILSGGV